MSSVALALADTPLAGRGALLVVGLLLLVAGRKLFWLALAALGFVAGWQLMERLGPDLPRTALLVVAVAMGVIGLVLAIVVQKVAVGLAGFLLGAVIAVRLLPLLGLELGAWQGLVVAAVGIVGAVVALALFGLALEVLTAGAGASLLVEAFRAPAAWSMLLLVVLWVVGVLLQRRWAR